jgi:hypothetical protein
VTERFIDTSSLSGIQRASGSTQDREAQTNVDTTSLRGVQRASDYRGFNIEYLRPEEDFSPSGMRQRLLDDRARVQSRLDQAFETASQYGYNYSPGGSAGQALASRQANPWDEVRSAYFAMLMSYQNRQAGNLTKYPQLAAAALEANVDERDVARLVNYVEADRGAEQLLAAFSMAGQDPRLEPERDRIIQNVMGTASPVMQLAIWDVFTAKFEELASGDGDVEEDQTWLDAVKNGIAVGLGYIFAPLEEANEFVQQLYRANVAAVDDNAVRGALALLPGVGLAVNGATYWDRVAEGEYDQKLLSTAREEYGSLTIDLLLEVEQLAKEGDPDPLITVLEKYSSDPERMAIIRPMFYKDAGTENVQSAARAIDQAHLGNTGQFVFSTLLGETGLGSEGRDFAAATTNVVATLALDPTIVGAKVYSAYRGAKYALEAIAPGASRTGVRNALNSRQSRRYFGNLLNDVNRYEELRGSDPAAASLLRERIRRQYAEVPDDMIDEITTAGVKDLDGLADWIIETNSLFLMANGQAARELVYSGPAAFRDQSFAGSIVQRGSALNRTPMVPTMTPARLARMKFSRAFGTVAAPTRRGREAIALGYNNTDDVDAIIAASSGPKSAMRIAAVERGGILTPGAYGKRVDSFFKYFSSLPNQGYVSIADARDSRVFYRWARSMLSRQQAVYLTDAFRRANPGQRYNMIVGLNRTSAAAKGLDLTDEAVLSRVDELVKPTSSGTKFAATVRLEDGTEVLPSDFNGVEKALFGWQTATHVAIPSMRDMELLAKWRGVVPEWIQNSPQNATDIWSLGTLFGWRFAMRSAIEDLWFYSVITGGNIGDLYSARRVSTSIREATGRKRQKAGLFGGAGNEQQALGAVNRRMRNLGDWIESRDGYLAESFSRFIRGNLSQEDVARAYEAARKGDFAPMRNLTAAALTRARFTGISDADMKYVDDLVSGPFGLKILDDLAETGRTINSGGFADDAAPIAGTDAPGVGLVAVPKEGQVRGPTGEFFDLPLDGTRPEAFLYWERHINGAIGGDWDAGRLAVAYLDDPKEAIRRVADEIRTDPKKVGYSWRFAALQDVSEEEFARRKVTAIRSLFSDADGNFNEKLWRRVVDENRNVKAFDVGENGERLYRITAAFLEKGVPKEQRPAFVAGQAFEPIPTANGLEAFTDRSWGWMGEQYARISREPVFIANYLNQRKALAGMERQLTEEIGEKAARRHVSRIAEDRAYHFTLSYMDNPQNRSILAWKVRNVSRYYRATEDFYRRVARAGKNYPVGLWKTALIYDVLDDTGFVYEDDNGDKYFMYPGSEYAMSAVNRAMQILGGVEPMDMSYPFALGGKVNMLAPSTDPNQMFPTIAGPFAAVGWKMLAARFPAMSRLNQYVLGEYGASAATTVPGILSESLLPAGILRVMNAMNEDERDSMFAAAAKDAMAIAIANDQVPADKNDPGWADAVAAVNTMAWASVMVRFGMGLMVPASPQRYNDNITEYARIQGSVDMRNAFLDLVGKKGDAGSENPVGEALVDWFRLNPGLFPFTVSKTERNPELEGSIKGLSPLKYSQSVSDWWNDNAELRRKYPQTAYFLAPQDEGFSWDTWGLVKGEGFRVSKNLDTFMRDVFAAQGEFHYYATYDDYQRDIDALDPRIPEQYSQIRELQAQRSEDLKVILAQNPFTDMKMDSRNYGARQGAAEDALPAVKRMVDDLYDTTPKDEWEGSAAQAIRNSILTYLDYKTELDMITGTTAEENQRKRVLRFGMEKDLEVLGEQNANARLFIRNVLMREPALNGMFPVMVGGE